MRGIHLHARLLSRRDSNPDGMEPEWPEADVIVGNPPFLGGSKLLANLGEDYVSRLRSLYQGRVPGGADLVTYWFEKARAQIEAGKIQRAGLVATQAIRTGNSNKVLASISGSSGTIHRAAGRRADLRCHSAKWTVLRVRHRQIRTW